MWIIGIAVCLVILAALICFGYTRPSTEWTGFGQTNVKKDIQPAKTLWDWMDLLIVPIVLAIGGYLFTRSESRATQAAAERRAQDEALQAYLEHMSAMLLPQKGQPSMHDESPPANLQFVARARTLTALQRLDGERKASVVQFLYESDLITKDRAIVDLKGADLRDANLSVANLRGADLSEVNLRGADLSHANLTKASLNDADLDRANLWNANLLEADLTRANLRRANLIEAGLPRANLSDANLLEADLTGALLTQADLTGALLTQDPLTQADLSSGARPSLLGARVPVAANLQYADLRGAILREAHGWTELLRKRKDPRLKGTTMPDGLKYEDWRKYKGRGQDGENSGP